MIETSQADKQRRPTKLLWLDLEFTGLDPKKYVIIEAAAKVTDFDFQPIANFSVIIHHNEAVIAAATEWNQSHHTASGLFDKVRTSHVSNELAANQLADFIRKHFDDEKAILAGNSVHQDLAFIEHYWPSVAALLHFRMLDVSAFKVLYYGKTGLKFEKEHAHRVEDDIDDSITELKFYLENISSLRR